MNTTDEDKIKELIDELNKDNQKNKFPEIPEYTGPHGWICPRCGRGNAPGCNTCCCMPYPTPVITYDAQITGNITKDCTKTPYRSYGFSGWCD